MLGEANPKVISKVRLLLVVNVRAFLEIVRISDSCCPSVFGNNNIESECDLLILLQSDIHFSLAYTLEGN